MKLFPLHLIPNDTQYNFMKLRYVTVTVMLLMLAVSVALIATKGFNYALEFTGGTLVRTEFAQPVDADAVRQRLAAAGLDSAKVQSVGGGKEVLVRLPAQGDHNNEDASQKTAEAVRQAIGTADNPATVQPAEFVGPQVGRDLAINGMYAAIFVIVGFLIYIAFRFEWKFAVVASLTTMFDVLVTAGYFAATGREFDLTVLAGLLAVMGFSINDTIVVFDRVRENFRSLRVEPLEVMNRSINQTLSRTIITSLVFFLSVLALYLYAGESLKGLALTQMIGAVLGTVSSIFLACPLLTMGALKVTKQDLLPKAKDAEALARRP
ncbi:protein translocase subunit SecF [Pseudoxanthomonas kalamensis DSM 18571]|uniref:protein translocase subunit SecF n=1 Tax=Pseudoxanthomonas kalamensis TaxID=289483 RepID=UPI001391E02B|nr:protein translocase subunit SecF [Pseudoxanthomonas kalamensis]KAF1710337.1 protein translocase subunit SecF [Pseudoxanthomonas kalamensis DSM 18571]